MIEPWMAYVGAAGGVIGTVGGVIGTAISITSYRRVSAMKSLDLRIEVRRERNNVHMVFTNLIELRERAIKSRRAVAAATGQSRGGNMIRWERGWAEDQELIDELTTQVPGAEDTYGSLSLKELEIKLVALHRLRGCLESLTGKYEDDLSSDDSERDHLREDMRARRARFPGE